jgi:thermostable 8-oxoguanine DNA glycosylase
MISAIDYEKPFTTRKRYYEVVEVLKKCAKKVGLVPCQFQAIVWETFRNELIEQPSF